MAAELAAGYVSLTVKLAKGGMADVTKEVKKAGTEGGKSYSDEFNKQVEKDVGKKIPDTIGKAAKSGGAVAKAAKEAASEFGKGFTEGIDQELGSGAGTAGIPGAITKAIRNAAGGTKKAAKEAAEEFNIGFTEGVKQAIEGHGGVASSFDIINDKIRDVTEAVSDFGDATNIDTGPIERASQTISEKIGGISDAVSNTKDSLDQFKRGDISGGLQAAVDALKGLETALPKGAAFIPGDIARELQGATDNYGEVKTKVDGVTDSLQRLGDLAPGSSLQRFTEKAPLLGDLLATADTVRQETDKIADQIAHGDESLAEKIKKRLASATGLGALGDFIEKYLHPEIEPTVDEKPVENFIGKWSQKPIKPPVIPDTDGATQRLTSWFAQYQIGGGAVLEIPVRLKPVGPTSLFGSGAPGEGPSSGTPIFPGTAGSRLGQRATGGSITGPGGPTSDIIPIWASSGEHVLSAADVAKMGGQSGVYAFRRMLGGFAGGGAVDNPDVLAAMNLVGTPYSKDARNDCSGTVAQIINSVLGMSGSGLMSTKTASSWLAARGFIPGRGGPGQISVGWYDHGPNPNDGHMAMTLSNGQPAESGGSHGNFLVGSGAKGADSPQFDQHMYLPTLFGEGAAGSSSAPSTSAGGGAGGGGGLSSNPMRALQQIGEQQQALDIQKGEQIKKILPDFGQLADIGMGGLKETLLPPGFSDPTQWKSTKSIGALLGWIGGISGDPVAASILGGIGQGITGSGSGLYQGIMGAIPQPFGNLAPTADQFAPADQHSGTGTPPGPVPAGGVSIGTLNDNSGKALQTVQKESAMHNSPQTHHLTRLGRP